MQRDNAASTSVRDAPPNHYELNFPHIQKPQPSPFSSYVNKVFTNSQLAKIAVDGSAEQPSLTNLATLEHRSMLLEKPQIQSIDYNDHQSSPMSGQVLTVKYQFKATTKNNNQFFKVESMKKKKQQDRLQEIKQ